MNTCRVAWRTAIADLTINSLAGQTGLALVSHNSRVACLCFLSTGPFTSSWCFVRHCAQKWLSDLANGQLANLLGLVWSLTGQYVYAVHSKAYLSKTNVSLLLVNSTNLHVKVHQSWTRNTFCLSGSKICLAFWVVSIFSSNTHRESTLAY